MPDYVFDTVSPALIPLYRHSHGLSPEVDAVINHIAALEDGLATLVRHQDQQVLRRLQGTLKVPLRKHWPGTQVRLDGECLVVIPADMRSHE